MFAQKKQKKIKIRRATSFTVRLFIRRERHGLSISVIIAVEKNIILSVIVRSAGSTTARYFLRNNNRRKFAGTCRYTVGRARDVISLAYGRFVANSHDRGYIITLFSLLFVITRLSYAHLYRIDLYPLYTCPHTYPNNWTRYFVRLVYDFSLDLRRFLRFFSFVPSVRPKATKKRPYLRMQLLYWNHFTYCSVFFFSIRDTIL